MYLKFEATKLQVDLKNYKNSCSWPTPHNSGIKVKDHVVAEHENDHNAARKEGPASSKEDKRGKRVFNTDHSEIGNDRGQFYGVLSSATESAVRQK